MTSSKSLAGAQPYALSTRLEILANLIYLAQHTEDDLDCQRHYLEWAATVLADMKDHPALRD
jgi:hypothetical protein